MSIIEPLTKVFKIVPSLGNIISEAENIKKKVGKFETYLNNKQTTLEASVDAAFNKLNFGTFYEDRLANATWLEEIGEIEFNWAALFSIPENFDFSNPEAIENFIKSKFTLVKEAFATTTLGTFDLESCLTTIEEIIAVLVELANDLYAGQPFNFNQLQKETVANLKPLVFKLIHQLFKIDLLNTTLDRGLKKANQVFDIVTENARVPENIGEAIDFAGDKLPLIKEELFNAASSASKTIDELQVEDLIEAIFDFLIAELPAIKLVVEAIDWETLDFKTVRRIVVDLFNILKKVKDQPNIAIWIEEMKVYFIVEELSIGEFSAKLEALFTISEAEELLLTSLQESLRFFSKRLEDLLDLLAYVVPFRLPLKFLRTVLDPMLDLLQKLDVDGMIKVVEAIDWDSLTTKKVFETLRAIAKLLKEAAVHPTTVAFLEKLKDAFALEGISADAFITGFEDLFTISEIEKELLHSFQEILRFISQRLTMLLELLGHVVLLIKPLTRLREILDPILDTLQNLDIDGVIDELEALDWGHLTITKAFDTLRAIFALVKKAVVHSTAVSFLEKLEVAIALDGMSREEFITKLEALFTIGEMEEGILAFLTRVYDIISNKSLTLLELLKQVNFLKVPLGWLLKVLKPVFDLLENINLNSIAEVIKSIFNTLEEYIPAFIKKHDYWTGVRNIKIIVTNILDAGIDIELVDQASLVPIVISSPIKGASTSNSIPTNTGATADTDPPSTNEKPPTNVVPPEPSVSTPPPIEDTESNKAAMDMVTNWLKKSFPFLALDQISILETLAEKLGLEALIQELKAAVGWEEIKVGLEEKWTNLKKLFTEKNSLKIILKGIFTIGQEGLNLVSPWLKTIVQAVLSLLFALFDLVFGLLNQLNLFDKIPLPPPLDSWLREVKELNLYLLPAIPVAVFKNLVEFKF